ncbi:MAG: hypothetical protein M5U26_02370 [Planctomycetota bacterium]|nr:hypothetical protein [Planctomycetota bacterium]
MSSEQIRDVCLQVIAILERLGVPYLVAGSLASSLLGKPRQTLDADLVADLSEAHVGPFLAALGEAYYVEPATVRDAVRRKRTFNLIHLDTMLKVDVFPIRDEPYARLDFSRRVKLPYFDVPRREVWCASAEDIVLHKLRWFHAGGKVAQRQWSDAVDVLRVQRERLDRAYLAQWAAHFGIGDFLARAQAEAEAADGA